MLLDHRTISVPPHLHHLCCMMEMRKRKCGNTIYANFFGNNHYRIVEDHCLEHHRGGRSLSKNTWCPRSSCQNECKYHVHLRSRGTNLRGGRPRNGETRGCKIRACQSFWVGRLNMLCSSHNRAMKIKALANVWTECCRLDVERSFNAGDDWINDPLSALLILISTLPSNSQKPSNCTEVFSV